MDGDRLLKNVSNVVLIQVTILLIIHFSQHLFSIEYLMLLSIEQQQNKQLSILNQQKMRLYSNYGTAAAIQSYKSADTKGANTQNKTT